MKAKRMLLLGIALGVCATMGISAFGQPVIQAITAYINPHFYFTFDGEKAELPADYSILTYQGRSYLPAKFVAEQLGATVTYHNDTGEIEVKSKEPEVCPTPDPEPTTGSSITYKKLPQKVRTEEYTAEAFLLVKDDDGKRLWVKIENQSDDQVIQLDQSKTVVSVYGNSYDMDLNRAIDFDQRWYRDIQVDEEVEGYLLLPDKIDSRAEEITVVVQLRVTDRLNHSQVQPITFHIAL